MNKSSSSHTSDSCSHTLPSQFASQPKLTSHLSIKKDDAPFNWDGAKSYKSTKSSSIDVPLDNSLGCFHSFSDLHLKDKIVFYCLDVLKSGVKSATSCLLILC